jgi:hypothetical protein
MMSQIPVARADDQSGEEIAIVQGDYGHFATFESETSITS